MSLHRRSSRTLVGVSSGRGISAPPNILLSSWRRAPCVSVSWCDELDTAAAWRGRSSSRNGVVQRRMQCSLSWGRGIGPASGRGGTRSPPRAVRELSTAATSPLHRRARRWNPPSEIRPSAPVRPLAGSSRHPHAIRPLWRSRHHGNRIDPIALGRSAVGAIRRQPRRVRSRSSQRVADASTWVSSLTKWVVTTYGSDRKLGYVSLISRTSFSVSFGFRAILLIYTKMQIHYVSLEEIYLSLDISFTYFKI